MIAWEFARENDNFIQLGSRCNTSDIILIIEPKPYLRSITTWMPYVAAFVCSVYYLKLFGIHYKLL